MLGEWLRPLQLVESIGCAGEQLPSAIFMHTPNDDIELRVFPNDFELSLTSSATDSCELHKLIELELHPWRRRPINSVFHPSTKSSPTFGEKFLAIGCSGNYILNHYLISVHFDETDKWSQDGNL
jgi:hypothetical protein